MPKNFNKWLTTYLVIIHTLLGIVVVKSNIFPLIKDKLGIFDTKKTFSPYYNTLFSFQQRADKNLPKNTVVFIGNSHTQGLATAAVSNHSVNFGIASDTTLGVINRIPLYTSTKQAKAIVLEIGTNDLFKSSNEEIISNIEKILISQPEHIPVILNAIFPMDESRANQHGINQRINTINNAANKIASLHKNKFFLNFNSRLRDGTQQLSKKYHLGDGIHLNKKGYAIWIKALRNQLNVIDNIQMTHAK